MSNVLQSQSSERRSKERSKTQTASGDSLFISTYAVQVHYAEIISRLCSSVVAARGRLVILCAEPYVCRHVAMV